MHGAPASALTGFMRFLQLLSLHDFAQDPLLVDPLRSWSAAEAASALAGAQGHKRSESDAECAVCLPTPYDAEGTLWTQRCPGQTMLARAQALAKAALATLHGAVTGAQPVPRCAAAADCAETHPCKCCEHASGHSENSGSPRLLYQCRLLWSLAEACKMWSSEHVDLKVAPS